MLVVDNRICCTDFENLTLGDVFEFVESEKHPYYDGTFLMCQEMVLSLSTMEEFHRDEYFKEFEEMYVRILNVELRIL